ncbi:hypothetical protein BJ878DRAFT_224378 [Calycina marina]|uniref:Uncharacterized protein n=1 Tax=Calycina marina TaxID=1763456 RepID=A0A9P7YXF6_9HELO|nr:hypothetical protein BJ878DRAFT_224378 [Calycina marina]
MAKRYTPGELKFLRKSPLVAKPPNLRPAEQWMGSSPAEAPRKTANTSVDRTKRTDSDALNDQTNRHLHHISRNSRDPTDIVLGPPQTSFISATSSRNAKAFDSNSERPSLRHTEDSSDGFTLRGKGREGEDERGPRSALRSRRGDGEGELETGWEKVKLRKSFGAEGVERFNGRMGGLDRHKDDRRNKDREEGEGRERPQRGFGAFERSRDKNGDTDQEREPRRNGLGRGRTESWRDKEDAPPTPRGDRNSNGDRLVDRDRDRDRNRGWREKEHDDHGEQTRERGDHKHGRNERADRRWDRNSREEKEDREPEWMDEPANIEDPKAHTMEEFEKWKQSRKVNDAMAASKTPAEETAPKPDAGGSFFESEKEKLKVDTPAAIETGPDKFFGMWSTPKDEHPPESAIESKKEGATRPKAGGKASRFTSFFAAVEEPVRRDTEPVPVVPQGPPSTDLLASFFQTQATQANASPANQGSARSPDAQTPDVERAAFQQLLSKLKIQSNGPNTTPPANAQQQPQPPTSTPLPTPARASGPERQYAQPAPNMDLFQQYRPERLERHEERPNPTHRSSQHALQELLNQRQNAGSQGPTRPEQLLNDLVIQRHNSSSQGSFRPDQPTHNSQYLMDLLTHHPEPKRIEQTMVRGPPQRPGERQMPLDYQVREQMIFDREALQHHRDAQRERLAAQQQQRQSRPQAPPGFYDEPQLRAQHERHGPPPQPTQILQRPPPGLHNMQQNWPQSPSELGPQQQLRQPHIAPPPGLAAGPGRGMPMPQMYPPSFQAMNSYPPPDGRMQPPPGFFNPPPPGFLPPGVSGAGINGFPSPDAFGGQHFDGRGPPPSGYRR